MTRISNASGSLGSTASGMRASGRAARPGAFMLATVLALTTAAPFTASPALAVAEGSNAKDMFYQELKEQGQESFGVAYTIELTRPGQAPFLCNNRYSFKSGDSIRLHVKPNQPCYAYILLGRGASGKENVLLYPPPGEENVRIEAGREVLVPPRGVLTFDNTAGTETLVLAFSQRPIERTRSLTLSTDAVVNEDVLTGLPQKVGSYQVFSNDGAYSYDSSQKGAPGNGMVFIASKAPGEPIIYQLPLKHISPTAGNDTTPPMPVAPDPNKPPPPQPQGPNSPITDKWAFIVGVNKFQRQGINQLRWCVADALALKDFLIKEAGFMPNHVLTLTDQEATTHNIMRVMTKLLPNSVRPDDLVVLYFSTHGTGTPDKPNVENHIVTHDFDGAGNMGIPMQKMGDLIKANVKSNRVVTILDLCFSGNARDLDSRDYLDTIMQGCGQIIVSACGPNEFSLEDPGIGHGIFTYHLLGSLRKNKYLKTSFDDAKLQVTAAAKQKGGEQHPVVKYDRWKGNDVMIFAKPTSPH